MTVAEAYGPTSWRVVVTMLALYATLVASGFGLSRSARPRLARALAWAITAAALAITDRACAGEPPGFRMLALCGALLYAMKGVVAVEARRAGSPALGPGSWLAFAIGWFGMRPQAFARRGVPKASSALARRGAALLVVGIGLVALARLPDSRLIATLLLLPGLSLALHFGAFHLLAAFWRQRGYDVAPLFRAPAAARSLGEFWSRRWNLAFSQMTALAVARPVERALGHYRRSSSRHVKILAGRLPPHRQRASEHPSPAKPDVVADPALRAGMGRHGALLAGFLFSGILHEIAISWPVRAGFGRPMLYFALHGAATLAEQELLRRNRWPRGIAGRACTLALLLAPLPLLFHEPFLRGTMWPLAGR